MSKYSKLTQALEKLKKDNFSSIDFYRLKNGQNRVRILPASQKDDEDDWFMPVGVHYGIEAYPLICRKETFWADEYCPICDLVNELKAANDPDYKKMALRKRFYLRIISRDAGTNQVQLLDVGSTIFKAIAEIIANTEEYDDVLHWIKGRDLIIKKSGQGFDTTYSVLPSVKESPVIAAKTVLDTKKAILDLRDNKLGSFFDIIKVPSETEIMEKLSTSGLLGSLAHAHEEEDPRFEKAEEGYTMEPQEFGDEDINLDEDSDDDLGLLEDEETDDDDFDIMGDLDDDDEFPELESSSNDNKLKNNLETSLKSRKKKKSN